MLRVLTGVLIKEESVWLAKERINLGVLGLLNLEQMLDK